MKNRVYAAGIANRENDWIWQGTVVAESLASAKKILSKFKKKHRLVGRCEVVFFGPPTFTKRPAGVSNLTDLF
jgi:hypothetical protein